MLLEYKSPKYKKRIARIFEVNTIEDSFFFENSHCHFYCKVGSEKIVDDACKNIKIKSIVTKELMKSVEYRLED